MSIVRSDHLRGGQTTEPPARVWSTALLIALKLDRRADHAERLADLAAQEDEGDDRDDGDEREDQGVLRETLAFLVTIEEIHNGKIDRGHDVEVPPFFQSPRGGGVGRHGTSAIRSCQERPIQSRCVQETGNRRV